MEKYEIVKPDISSPHEDHNYWKKETEGCHQPILYTCDIKTKEHEISSNENEKININKKSDEEKILNLKNSIPDISKIFNIHKRIGSGTFSTVFLGSLKNNIDVEQNSNETQNLKNDSKRKLFAIKHIIPTSSPQRIIKELRCLLDIGGVENVIGVRLCLRFNENVAFVMPYIEHDKFQAYFDKMKPSEVQLYMKNLLIALRRVHKFNIIHRDVKPSNFLYNRKTKEFLLIDFGLAQNVIKYSDRQLSLLKRKFPGDNAINNSPETGNNSYISNPNKKLCTDKIIISELGCQRHQKSPEKMPLKQINVVNQSGAVIAANSSFGATGSGDQSVLLKNSKSESPNNINSQSISAGIGSNSNQKSNKCSNLCSEKPSVNDNQHNPLYPNKVQESTGIQLQHKCHCFGRPQVCKKCLIRKEIPASRAGTPGYRPPEVLLKYVDQTTAVDIWAVGVIFISILSGVYPFFKAPDDFVALAEIVMLFGDDVMRKTAFSLGRQLTMSRKCKPLNLRRLCVRLRNRNKINRSALLKKYEKNGVKVEECSNCQQMSYDCLCQNSKYKLENVGEDSFSKNAYDLLLKLLEVNPHKRITAAKALQHDFFKEKYD